jgi:HAD superfamily hydrolase (TIGR01509 family)
LPDYFDAISDGTNITNSKPHPEVFLKAAEMLSLNPEDCLVVEDARAGIDAAVNGGFKSAAIGDAAGYGREDFTLGSFSGLLSVCR